MQPDINSILGQPSEPKEENPLEKLNEASKNVNKEVKEKTDQASSFDDETFKRILMSGDNSEGLFTPTEKEEKENPKHAEVHEEAQIKQGKVSSPKGKYVNKFIKDITKNPQGYKVKTPKGEMTIAEAMRKGYNPITKTFEKDKSPEEIKKKHLEGLNATDKAKLEEITSPSAARIPSKDAKSMGLPDDSPMIDKGEGQAPAQIPAQAIAQSPQQAQPEQQGAQGIDINSMLGGMA